MFMKQSRPDDQTSQMTPGTTSKLYTFVLKVSENLREQRRLHSKTFGNHIGLELKLNFRELKLTGS